MSHSLLEKNSYQKGHHPKQPKHWVYVCNLDQGLTTLLVVFPASLVSANRNVAHEANSDETKRVLDP